MAKKLVLIAVLFSLILPDLLQQGGNYEDAVRMAHEALSGRVECMKKYGEKIPEPSALEDIKANWPGWEEWKETDFAITFISLLPKYENKKYTISMDSSLMAQIDAVAKNRSAFLAEAAKRLLNIA